MVKLRNRNVGSPAPSTREVRSPTEISVKRSNRRTIGTSSDDDEYQPGPPAKRKKADKAPAPVQASKPKPKRRQNRKPRITKREKDLEAELDEARDEHAGIAAQLRENNDQITSELEKMRVDYIKLERNGKLAIEEMSARLVRKSAEMETIQERYRVLEEQARAFKRDRTTQASLVPVSQKTEEEYLRDLQHLNQSIRDLAHRLSRGSKERRESLTFILIDQLWNKVFSVLVLGEDDADDEVLKSFHRGLQGNAQTMFQGLLYASENVRSRDHDTMTEEFCRRILEESPELRSIQDVQTVVQMAVRLHWAMSSEVKQARLVYFSRGSVFDAETMHTRGQSGAAVAAQADQNVERCLGFGFYGSAGTLEKVLVTIEEDCL